MVGIDADGENPGPAHGFHEPGAAELAQHLGEMVGRYAVGIRNLGRRNLAFRVARQFEHGEQREAGRLL